MKKKAGGSRSISIITKYIISDQNAHIKGRLNNHPVDSTIAFNEANGFYYFLNNGANFLLFNVTKRWHLYKSYNEKVKVDFLANSVWGRLFRIRRTSFFGKENHQGFQIGRMEYGSGRVPAGYLFPECLPGIFEQAGLCPVFRSECI